MKKYLGARRLAILMVAFICNVIMAAFLVSDLTEDVTMLAILLWFLIGLGAAAIGVVCGIALSEIMWRCWHYKEEND